MAIFNNKVKAAIVFVGLICALYGFSPVRGKKGLTFGSGTWKTTGGGTLGRAGHALGQEEFGQYRGTNY